MQRFASLSTAILSSISSDFPNQPKFLEKCMKCLSLFFIFMTRRPKRIILEYAGGKSCKSPRNVGRGSMHLASLQVPRIVKPNLHHFRISRKTSSTYVRGEPQNHQPGGNTDTLFVKRSRGMGINSCKTYALNMRPF